MVPLVHLQVVILHVSTTRAVIVAVMVVVTRMGAILLIRHVHIHHIHHHVTHAVIQAMIVRPAATRRASPMYTLKVVTNLTVGKDHTSLAVHVNFAQLASTCLTLRVQAVQKSRKDHK